MTRPVKREVAAGAAEEANQGATERRHIRSRYLAVKNIISEEREDVVRLDSDKFQSIITEVENLHRMVQKPREQVADAEALLDLANTLVTSANSQKNEGVTPSDFVTTLLRNFSQQDRTMSQENPTNVLYWVDVGLAVSHVFKNTPGCCTMVGPMNTEVKQRKIAVHRKRTRPEESTRPEELGAEKEQKTDTDKNMSTMFDVLRKNRNVRLENLVLNRLSFAQTVENIFALSFLVKDGRAEITVAKNGHHIVSPRNAPAANAVASGDVTYNHFVFRFDFKDWKLMMDTADGEDLMPHRCGLSSFGSSQAQPADGDSPRLAPRTTPIRKLSRNRGLVIQDQTMHDGSQDNDANANVLAGRKGKRALFA